METASHLVYFGAQPGPKQTVSDEVKSRGLNLLRLEPRQVNIVGGPTILQPNFSVYRSHLNIFLAAAMNDVPIKTSTPFQIIPHNNLPYLPITLPHLVITFSITIPDEVRDQLRGSGWKDTMVRGKPAMIHHHPTIEIVKDALSKKANTTSPAPEGAVNIFAFRKCLLLLRLLSTFLRVHQYPAFVDEDHEASFEEGLGASDPKPKATSEDAREDVEMSDTDTWDIKFKSKVHLIHPPSEQPIFYDDHSAPFSAGVLFPYVPELAIFDRYTVVETVKRYFYNGLGEDAEECREAFSELVSAWGVILNTEFGNILSHIFKVLDVCLTMQAQLVINMSCGVYHGSFMRGTGYAFTSNGREVTIGSTAQITASLKLMDTHAEALWFILSKLDLPEGQAEEQFRTILRMSELKRLLDVRPVQGGSEMQARIQKKAVYLNFPRDVPMDATAANISECLSYISNPLLDIYTLPSMHHSVLFSQDRASIAWSAFGESAPSFRVPGGKQMDLTAPFQVTNAAMRKKEGASAHRDVKKMAAVILPLSEAISHLKATIKDNLIFNPYANSTVAFSTGSLAKAYEGESCDMIVSALRKVNNITVTSGSGTKRKDRDEEKAGSSKKGRLDEL